MTIVDKMVVVKMSFVVITHQNVLHSQMTFVWLPILITSLGRSTDFNNDTRLTHTGGLVCGLSLQPLIMGHTILIFQTGILPLI